MGLLHWLVQLGAGYAVRLGICVEKYKHKGIVAYSLITVKFLSSSFGMSATGKSGFPAHLWRVRATVPSRFVLPG
jgi:hypothetical protein